MKPFLKLLLLFLGTNILIYFIFYGDQLNTTVSPSIGGGGYNLTYFFYLVALIFFLSCFNLFLGISTLYLKSKARDNKVIRSFLWISIPALIVAIGLLLVQLK